MSYHRYTKEEIEKTYKLLYGSIEKLKLDAEKHPYIKKMPDKNAPYKSESIVPLVETYKNIIEDKGIPKGSKQGIKHELEINSISWEKLEDIVDYVNYGTGKSFKGGIEDFLKNTVKSEKKGEVEHELENVLIYINMLFNKAKESSIHPKTIESLIKLYKEAMMKNTQDEYTKRTGTPIEYNDNELKEISKVVFGRAIEEMVINPKIDMSPREIVEGLKNAADKGYIDGISSFDSAIEIIKNEYKKVIDEINKKAEEEMEAEKNNLKNKLMTFFRTGKQAGNNFMKNINNIYIDMDGVICDFFGGLEKALKINIKEDKDFRKAIEEEEESMVDYLEKNHGVSRYAIKEVLSDPEFWENLEWIEGGEELINTLIEKFGIEKIHILTSPSIYGQDESKRGKRNWVGKNIPELFDRIIFDNKKYKYAEPGAVLIDDRAKNNRWFKDHEGEAIQMPSPLDPNRMEKVEEIIKEFGGDKTKKDEPKKKISKTQLLKKLHSMAAKNFKEDGGESNMYEEKDSRRVDPSKGFNSDVFVGSEGKGEWIDQFELMADPKQEEELEKISTPEEDLNPTIEKLMNFINSSPDIDTYTTKYFLGYFDGIAPGIAKDIDSKIDSMPTEKAVEITVEVYKSIVGLIDTFPQVSMKTVEELAEDENKIGEEEKRKREIERLKNKEIDDKFIKGLTESAKKDKAGPFKMLIREYRNFKNVNDIIEKIIGCPPYKYLEYKLGITLDYEDLLKSKELRAFIGMDKNITNEILYILRRYYSEIIRAGFEGIINRFTSSTNFIDVAESAKKESEFIRDLAKELLEGMLRKNYFKNKRHKDDVTLYNTISEFVKSTANPIDKIKAMIPIVGKNIGESQEVIDFIEKNYHDTQIMDRFKDFINPLSSIEVNSKIISEVIAEIINLYNEIKIEKVEELTQKKELKQNMQNMPKSGIFTKNELNDYFLNTDSQFANFMIDKLEEEINKNSQILKGINSSKDKIEYLTNIIKFLIDENKINNLINEFISYFNIHNKTMYENKIKEIINLENYNDKTYNQIQPDVNKMINDEIESILKDIFYKNKRIDILRLEDFLRIKAKDIAKKLNIL